MALDGQITQLIKATGVKNVAKTKSIVYGVAGLVGAGLLAIVIIKVIKGAKKRNAEDYNILDANNELGNLGVQSKKLTITDGQAILISQNLLAAMDRYGTDEQSIYDQLNQCNTKDDLLLVIQKFGTKLYDGAGLADNYLDRKLFSTMKNLSGWLRAELNKKEIAKVKEIYDRLGVAL